MLSVNTTNIALRTMIVITVMSMMMVTKVMTKFILMVMTTTNCDYGGKRDVEFGNGIMEKEKRR